MRSRRPDATRAIAVRSALALVLALALPAGAQQSPLATTQIRILGLAVDVDTRPDLDGLQATMTAVRDVPTGLATFVGSPADAAARAAPPGALVKAELSGPTFGAAVVTIAGPPNQLLEIPLLRVAGLHYVTNVRLEDAGGNVLLARDPAADPVVIDVLDQLLVTQVTSRELTLEEIRAKGIVIDEDNFTVLNFAVALTLGSERVTIEFPSIVPAAGAVLQELDCRSSRSSPPVQSELRRINIPNFSLTGFRMRAPPEQDEKEFNFPPVDGVIIIPGNLAFLNQFFSVIVQATNTAPDGSGLVLHAARAAIDLPDGDDAIPDTGDDPLRVAETSAGGVQTELPLARRGRPRFDRAARQQRGGVPGRGPARRHAPRRLHARRRSLRAGARAHASRSRASPRASCRCATRPSRSCWRIRRVVREGEPYSMFATVTNTSASAANLFQIELARRSLSGARFADGETAARTLETLRGGESETFEWRLVARTTGEVTGTVFLADPSINGSFVLTAGVGDTGIPLSPDTLVLPQTADALPDDFLFAAVRMLGQAYSVATAPGGSLPPDIARIGKAWVFERAVRHRAGRPARALRRAARTPPCRRSLLDWLGNDRARLATLLPDAGERAIAEQDLRAWDALRRAAERRRGLRAGRGARARRGARRPGDRRAAARHGLALRVAAELPRVRRIEPRLRRRAGAARSAGRAAGNARPGRDARRRDRVRGRAADRGVGRRSRRPAARRVARRRRLHARVPRGAGRALRPLLRRGARLGPRARRVSRRSRWRPAAPGAWC